MEIQSLGLMEDGASLYRRTLKLLLFPWHSSTQHINGRRRRVGPIFGGPAVPSTQIAVISRRGWYGSVDGMGEGRGGGMEYGMGHVDPEHYELRTAQIRLVISSNGKPNQPVLVGHD